MNRVLLIGRITAKPELSYTAASQTAVTKFTIAIDRSSKDAGADFIRVTAFGRQAETICSYMDKGRQIAVEGRIQTGSYKDKDGKTVYTQDVIIDHSEFLGSSQSAERIEQKARDMFMNETPARPQAPVRKSRPDPIQQTWNDLPDSFAAAEEELPF